MSLTDSPCLLASMLTGYLYEAILWALPLIAVIYGERKREERVSASLHTSVVYSASLFSSPHILLRD